MICLLKRLSLRSRLQIQVPLSKTINFKKALELKNNMEERAEKKAKNLNVKEKYNLHYNVNSIINSFANELFVGCNSKSKIALLHLGNSRRTNGPHRDKRKRPLCRRCNNARNGKGTPFRSAQEKTCCKHISQTPGRRGKHVAVKIVKNYGSCPKATYPSTGICKGTGFWQYTSHGNELGPLPYHMIKESKLNLRASHPFAIFDKLATLAEYSQTSSQVANTHFY